MFYLVNFKFRNPDTGEYLTVQHILNNIERRNLSVVGAGIKRGSCSLDAQKFFRRFNSSCPLKDILVSNLIVVSSELVSEIKQSEHYINPNTTRWCVIDGVYYPSLKVAAKKIGINYPTMIACVSRNSNTFKSRGKEYQLNEIGPPVIKQGKIKINGRIFESTLKADQYYGSPCRTIYNRIHVQGKPNKGTFTYKGEDYHFEFLDVKEK